MVKEESMMNEQERSRSKFHLVHEDAVGGLQLHGLQHTQVQTSGRRIWCNQKSHMYEFSAEDTQRTVVFIDLSSMETNLNRFSETQQMQPCLILLSMLVFLETVEHFNKRKYTFKKKNLHQPCAEKHTIVQMNQHKLFLIFDLLRTGRIDREQTMENSLRQTRNMENFNLHGQY